MLNSKLTVTMQGEPDDPIHRFSEKFVQDLVKFISVLPQTKCFMLWGGDAKKMSKFITESETCKIFTWSHPGPMADNKISDPKLKFASNTNFNDVNRVLSLSSTSSSPKIIWNTFIFDFDLPELLIFTDGSCNDNGKATCTKAGYAFIVLKRVAQPNIRFDRETYSGPGAQYVLEHKFGGIVTMADLPSDTERPSNNVGELFGITKGLEYAREHSYTSVAVISDSGYCLDLLNNLTINIEKNIKLVAKLHEVAGNFINLRSMHVRSHQRLVPSAKDKFFIYWNDQVDQLAAYK
jgi:ribonuclease HI